MFTMNFWIIWMLVSMFGICLIGWKRQFVTTKLSGKLVVVTRIPMKAVKIMICVATIIFAALLIGECLFVFRQALGDNFSAFEYAFRMVKAAPLVIITIVFYHFAMRFLFNNAREAHEAEMRAELKGE